MSSMIEAPEPRPDFWRPLFNIPNNLKLIETMTRRDMATRYRASVLGILWSLVNPLIMIGIFTFVFSVVLRTRFGPSQTSTDFALYVFCGLLPWLTFQEMTMAASVSIVTNVNLVKRVVFPLEILPITQLVVSHIHQFFGLCALLLGLAIVRQKFEVTLVWLPVLLVPQVLFYCGVAWFVAAVGVYLRDVPQALGAILTGAFYLTPVLYPEEAVPYPFATMIRLNPFSALVFNYRRIMLEGLPPDWTTYGYLCAWGIGGFFLGYWWFARTRKGFADVL